MKYLAVLGRQPEISLAELSALFQSVKKQNHLIATFESETEPNINRLGGSLKLAKKLENISPEAYLANLPVGKITLGISDYTSDSEHYSSRDIKNISHYGIQIKQALKKQNRSVRLLPNSTPIISSAAAHHNGLGRHPKKVELIKYRNDWYVSIGVQNITAYKNRDQVRPARDAKVGMLPPKLAQILINLCGPLPENSVVLDPFCGTGVVLQEALLIGYRAYGTDQDERMVKYAEKNLTWLQKKTSEGSFTVEPGDATTHHWAITPDAIASEIYLGPPMSEPPATIKLRTVKEECGAILTNFLKNLAPQISENTPIVLAVPAWRRPGHTASNHTHDPAFNPASDPAFNPAPNPALDHTPNYTPDHTPNPTPNNRASDDHAFEHLKTVDEIEKLGYNVLNQSAGELLYARENQIVAREIIILRKKSHVSC